MGVEDSSALNALSQSHRATGPKYVFQKPACDATRHPGPSRRARFFAPYGRSCPLASRRRENDVTNLRRRPLRNTRPGGGGSVSRPWIQIPRSAQRWAFRDGDMGVFTPPTLRRSVHRAAHRIPGSYSFHPPACGRCLRANGRPGLGTPMVSDDDQNMCNL